MKHKYWGAIGLIVLLAGPLQAVEQRGALVLNKIPIFEFEDPRKNVCIAMYDVEDGRDVPDMREFRDFLCQGRYEMTLRGKKGRTVTLYAQFNFGQNSGFLVVRKADGQQVWIHDLENLPAGQWITVKGNPQSGGYQAFYSKGALFDQNLSSIKWGTWWKGKTPR